MNPSSDMTTHTPKNNKGSLPLLVINYLILFVGSVSATLLSKYYFIHKGSNIWVSTWVQCAGFPLLLPPILIPYFLNLTSRRPFTQFTPKIFAISIFVGLMLGLNNLLFSIGNSNLPVSTSSLLLSSQLVFNLLLSVLIVKQKVTFSNLNCVILLTVSSVLLGLGSSHDKPPGLTRAKYFVGSSHGRCRLALRSVSPHHGKSLPQGRLLLHDDGNADGDGGRRHDAGDGLDVVERCFW
ncbi:hypothetical protein M0R45_014076 [Rubus argutus]|uniref:Uncharacterized protein n=1 Tax=Rubus argutus TaxID=59490 RepID=A0AAW1XN16_RUBAR